jgi:hypothetical protein
MPASQAATIRLSDQVARRPRRPLPPSESDDAPIADEPESPPGSDFGEQVSTNTAAPGPADRVEQIVEYANSLGLRPQVDVDSGVISGVKILGPASRNGRRYRAAAMAAAAPLYEGVKVNVNHPKGGAAAPRDYQDRLGCLRNVRASDGGLFGDLHFNPHHPVARQLAWDAQRAPENVGLSHNVQARTSRQEGQTVVEQILRVNSVDLVADPATTQGLFESASEPAAAETPACETAPRHENMPSEAAITEARQQLLEKRRQIQGWLRESRLPTDAASPDFIERLETLDLAAAQGLIQERASFYRSLSGVTGKPRSKGPEPDAEHGGDVRRWARLVT